MSPLPSVSDRVRFDLEMHLRMQSEGNLRGTVVYSTDLFDAATIGRLVGHFQRLLEGIVADPDVKIVALPLLTDAERHQLLVEWNNTARDYPADHCVHQLFEEQVERTPDAVAVVFENQELTYGELNARSNQLAHYLQSQGVGPEDLVAVCMERSVEMVVGVLGVLKAGGPTCRWTHRIRPTAWVSCSMMPDQSCFDAAEPCGRPSPACVRGCLPRRADCRNCHDADRLDVTAGMVRGEVLGKPSPALSPTSSCVGFHRTAQGCSNPSTCGGQLIDFDAPRPGLVPEDTFSLSPRWPLTSRRWSCFFR